MKQALVALAKGNKLWIFLTAGIKIKVEVQ
jgi:hypothetical protein